MSISTLEQAEAYVLHLKRSDNWVSDAAMLQNLQESQTFIENNKRADLLPHLGIHFALYYIDNGEYQQSWKYTEIAKENALLYANNAKLLEAISIQIRIQRYLGNLEAAQKLVHEQIEIAYRINDYLQIASAYQNQTLLLHKQHLKEDCIEAGRKAIEYIQKSKMDYYIANFKIGFSGILLDFNETSIAFEQLNQGFNIAKKNKFKLPLALAYSNYGTYYQLVGNEKKCIDAYKKCIALFHQINNTTDEMTAKIMLADAYEYFNKISEAEQTLKETIAFSEQNGIKYNLIGIYETLSKLQEKKGNYIDALANYKKLNQIKEEYLNNETKNKLQKLETNMKLDVLKIEKENAEKMASVKHDFLANMSHEIRTPINSILGICYLLEQQTLNEIQHNYIQRLKRSGENLLGIINDVLDISKIESGKMELTNDLFSLDDLINDIFNALEPKAKDKEIQFKIINRFKKKKQLLGDKIRLYQILLNIVSNAIKFTNEGSVTLLTDCKETDAHHSQITFTIKDTGIGITKNKIDKIFERYEQADATIKDKFGGTGLGLSISKKIVQLMNGTIDIKSKLNKGTEFIISIPMKNAVQMNEVATDDIMITPELLNNKLILIADDNLENRLVAKEILLNFNKTIKVIEANDGNEVINLLFKKIPDIIFMDLDMPNLNGIETTQQIRKNKKYHTIKIIGNTASLSSFTKEEFHEIGFDAFIYKPYKPKDLYRLLVTLLTK